MVRRELHSGSLTRSACGGPPSPRGREILHEPQSSRQTFAKDEPLLLFGELAACADQLSVMVGSVVVAQPFDDFAALRRGKVAITVLGLARELRQSKGHAVGRIEDRYRDLSS